MRHSLLCNIAMGIIACIASGIRADLMTFVGTNDMHVLAGFDDTTKADTVQTGNRTVRGNSANFLWKTYMRFDISSLPLGATITNVSFTVQSNNSAADSINLYGILDEAPNENYDPAILTYNNAPGHVPAIYNIAGTFVSDNAGMDTNTSAFFGNLGSSSVSVAQPGNRYTYTVSNSQLATFVGADSNGIITMALTPDEGQAAAQFFIPGNGGDETVLNVYYIPEPGTMSLVFIGAICWWIRRRTGE
jgi:cyclophilin family peptidyl-prolyl cis-trans isomerase